MKELVIDFRKQGGGHSPIYINRAKLEMVESVKLLGVMIAINLFSSIHTDMRVKKAQQCLYFLRRLRKFDMSMKTLSKFNGYTIESILSRCIMA
eukprot:g20912.t1